MFVCLFVFEKSSAQNDELLNTTIPLKEFHISWMYHSEHKMTLIFIHTLEYYQIVYHGVRQNNAHISSDIQLIYKKYSRFNGFCCCSQQSLKIIADYWNAYRNISVKNIIQYVFIFNTWLLVKANIGLAHVLIVLLAVIGVYSPMNNHTYSI